MATELKLRRGTTSQNNAFTGVEGEITVDTTKKTVVVQDGTAGGSPLVTEEGTQTISGAKTFTSSSGVNIDGQLTTGDILTVEGDSASDVNSNPEINIENNEAADTSETQALGIIKFKGKNTSGQAHQYGLITGYASDPTDGQEDGKVSIRVADGDNSGNHVTPFSANKNGVDVRGRLFLGSDVDSHLDPDITFRNHETNPSDDNVLGQMWFEGSNSNNNTRSFANIEVQAKDVTAGDEDAAMYFKVDKDGTRTTRLTVDKDGITTQNRIHISGASGGTDLENGHLDPDLIFTNNQGYGNGNVCGQTQYWARNDANQNTEYVRIDAKSSSTANGSEYGAYILSMKNDGLMEQQFQLHRNNSYIKTHQFTIEGKTDVNTGANPTFIIRNDEDADTSNSQTLGVIAFDGNNEVGDNRYYSYISATAVDPTEDAEIGRLNLNVRDGSGTARNVLQITKDGANVDGNITTKNSIWVTGDSAASSDPSPFVVLDNPQAGVDDDKLGVVEFRGRDANGEVEKYTHLIGRSVTAADGTESGRLDVVVADGSGGNYTSLVAHKDGIDVGGDGIKLTDHASGIVMRSPNGTNYKLTVDNSGNLQTTQVV